MADISAERYWVCTMGIKESFQSVFSIVTGNQTESQTDHEAKQKAASDKVYGLWTHLYDEEKRKEPLAESCAQYYRELEGMFMQLDPRVKEGFCTRAKDFVYDHAKAPEGCLGLYKSEVDLLSDGEMLQLYALSETKNAAQVELLSRGVNAEVTDAMLGFLQAQADGEGKHCPQVSVIDNTNLFLQDMRTGYNLQCTGRYPCSLREFGQYQRGEYDPDDYTPTESEQTIAKLAYESLQ